MSTDFIVSAGGTGPNAYPGVEFDSTDGVYREDREVDGIMYRAINATFDGSMWSLVDPGASAYAITQNPDNTIGHLTNPPTSPWPTNKWLGTTNITIFYAADYGLSTSDMVGTPNTAALQAAVNAAAAAGGGVVYISDGVYLLNGQVNVPTVWPPAMGSKGVGFVISGADAGTELAQQDPSVPIFSIVPTYGDNGQSGVLIQRLRLKYASVDVSVTPQVYAVHSEAASVVCRDCYFGDCPAMYMGGLQNGLTCCTIDYDVDQSDITENATMVFMTGSQDFVDQTTIRQKTQHKGGPTGCVGIEIGTVSTCFVSNDHISDFDTGIYIHGGTTPNLIHGFFSNISCQSWSHSVLIQPNVSGGTVLKLPGFRGHFPLCGEGSTNGQETSSCLPLGVPG